MKKSKIFIITFLFIKFSLAQNIVHNNYILSKRAKVTLKLPLIDSFTECSSDSTISYIFSLLTKKNSGLVQVGAYLKYQDFENTKKGIFDNHDFYTINLFENTLGIGSEIVLKKVATTILKNFSDNDTWVINKNSFQNEINELTEKVNDVNYFKTHIQALKVNVPVLLSNSQYENNAYTMVILNKTQNLDEENDIHYVLQYVSLLLINKNIYQFIRTKRYYGDFDLTNDKTEFKYLTLKFLTLNKLKN